MSFWSIIKAIGGLLTIINRLADAYHAHQQEQKTRSQVNEELRNEISKIHEKADSALQRPFDADSVPDFWNDDKAK